MKITCPHPAVIDFETLPIRGSHPAVFPPEPVGVSIKKWGKKAKYWCWDHRTGVNNCTLEEAIAAIEEVWGGPVLFHNMKFDLRVAVERLGFKLPPPEQCHDTLFLAFLHNPEGSDLTLKWLANKLLGMPPGERDELVEWLLENQPLKDQGVRLSPKRGAKNKYGVPTYAGAYVAYAPPEIAGPYANGDSDRTEALFRFLYPFVVENGMLEAYKREQHLCHMLIENEQHGIRCDLERLRKDVVVYRAAAQKTEKWIRKRIGADPSRPISGQALVAQLSEAGLVDLGILGKTPKGQWQTTVEALEAAVTDRTLSAVLRYHSQLHTCMATFLEPWLEVAEQTGGLIFTNWNQVRGSNVQGGGGTRTGRLSSSPNFQNIPKQFAAIWWHEKDKEDNEKRAAGLPRIPKALSDLPALPLCRGYIIPMHEGYVLVDRDISQQELRILAHFEDGALVDQYWEDPWTDYHDNVKEQLEQQFGRKYPRKNVKIVNLSIIYGQGLKATAAKLNEPMQEARQLRNGVFKLYPGLREVQNGLEARAKAGEPFTTWGGRIYHCEEPIIWFDPVNKVHKTLTFEYKCTNTLIQGSAADCTKAAMVRFYHACERERNRDTGRWYIYFNVHDEIVVSVPREDLSRAMEMLRQAIESLKFDVLIKSEGTFTDTNWIEMKEFDKRGVMCGRIGNDGSWTPMYETYMAKDGEEKKRPCGAILTEVEPW